MKWFQKANNIDELRIQYKKLLIKYHPDNGGRLEDMQEINAEYDLLFDHISKENKSTKQTDKNNDGEQNQAFKEVLNKIIGYKIKIEIIGAWIWCFDAYAYKEKLKEIDFKFAPKKKAWCWHYGEYKRHHNKEVNMNDIRVKYGSQTVEYGEEQKVLGLSIVC